MNFNQAMPYTNHLTVYFGNISHIPQNIRSWTCFGYWNQCFEQTIGLSIWRKIRIKDQKSKWNPFNGKSFLVYTYFESIIFASLFTIASIDTLISSKVLSITASETWWFVCVCAMCRRKQFRRKLLFGGI